MAKSGGTKGEKAASSCLTAGIWLVFALAVLVVIYMVVVNVYPPILENDFMSLNFLQSGPKTYKEAKRLASKGEREKAISRFHEFLKSESAEASEEQIIQAHLTCARMYLSLARDLDPFNPEDQYKNGQYCKSGLNHIDQVLKIRRDNKPALELQTFLYLQQG